MYCVNTRKYNWTAPPHGHPLRLQEVAGCTVGAAGFLGGRPWKAAFAGKTGPGGPQRQCHNVLRTLKCLCSSRDGVHLGPEKETCPQGILSKWMDTTSLDPPLLSLDSTFKNLRTKYLFFYNVKYAFKNCPVNVKHVDLFLVDLQSAPHLHDCHHPHVVEAAADEGDWL